MNELLEQIETLKRQREKLKADAATYILEAVENIKALLSEYPDIPAPAISLTVSPATPPPLGVHRVWGKTKREVINALPEGIESAIEAGNLSVTFGQKIYQLLTKIVNNGDVVDGWMVKRTGENGGFRYYKVLVPVEAAV